MTGSPFLSIGYGMKLSNLNGYTADGATKKERFHRDGRMFLKSIAKALDLPPGSFDIRSNRAGIAVSGEVTLHADHLYVQLSESCMRPGVSALYRSCLSRKDYRGGTNHFSEPRHILGNAAAQARFLRECEKLITEGATAANQLAVA